MTKFSLVDRKAFDFGIGIMLHPAEIHMVTTVDMLGEAGVTELAEEFGTTKGAVSQLVGRLVAKDLLIKEVDSGNRSRVIIRTTELGQKASNNHLDFHKGHDREFMQYLGGLDDEAYETVNKLGKEMNFWMDRYLK